MKEAEKAEAQGPAMVPRAAQEWGGIQLLAYHYCPQHLQGKRYL